MIPCINWNIPDDKVPEFSAQLNLSVQLADFLSRRRRLAERLAGVVILKNNIVGAHKERQDEIPFYLQNYFSESAEAAAGAEMLLRDFEATIPQLEASCGALVSLCNTSMEAKETAIRSRELACEEQVEWMKEECELKVASVNGLRITELRQHEEDLIANDETRKQEFLDREAQLQNKVLVLQDEYEKMKAERNDWRRKYIHKGRGKK